VTRVPFDLPVRPADAAALASLLFEHAAGKPLSEDLRNRLAGRAAGQPFDELQVFFGSLERDPVHQTAWYLAAEGVGGAPVLLHIAPGSAPTPSQFPGALLIGRMRTASGAEFVANAIPFGPADHTHIAAFAANVNPAFFPRPQGSQPAIAVGNRHPEISLPAAFDAFRTFFKRRGINIASTVQLSATREMTTEEVLAARDGENPIAAGHTRVSIRALYHAGLRAAIRAGWREGYNAEADHFIVSGDSREEIARSTEATKTAISHAAGYTKFTTDTSRLFLLEADPRHPQAWPESAVEERYERAFTSSERQWIEDEFVRRFEIGDSIYEFSPALVRRLAVKFGESLKLNEELFDYIRTVKAGRPEGRAFDFEPSLDEAETLTTPQELIFYMHWLKQRGRPAQLVPPNLGFKKRQAYPVAMESSAESGVGLLDYAAHKMWPELAPRAGRDYDNRPLDELSARIAELAAIARHYQGTLSIHSGSGKQAEVLEAIGRATSGRVNYKISGELQLQLFDVLYEEPETSPWRKLYERLAARADAFASQGAFGAEGALAAEYRQAGKGSYLGDSRRGRVDGNLFLVFWAGNMVGSRDVDAPDGDRRFFRDKLDELPASLLDEVRRRNTAYVLWLAEHLFC
jgi:hypothetical protein